MTEILTPFQIRAQAEIERRKRLEAEQIQHIWPKGHISHDGKPVPYHKGQELAANSESRITALLAGTQGGKTGFGPWWLADEIGRRGTGDYIAVTATYDLFKLKMLPSLLEVFEDILQIGRFWAGDRIIELADPETKSFKAKKSSDPMWGRIILRSADALGGLESATAKGAWLDEAGQPGFVIRAWRAIRRRIALHRGRVLITTTLYDIGWLDKEILDRAAKGGIINVFDINGGELDLTVNEKAGITLIQFDSIVNPSYPKEEFDEAKELLPKDEFEMQYRGRKATLRTMIYDNFDESLHTCTRFPVPEHWERYVGMDFGGVNTAAVFYAEEPVTKRLYCYKIYKAGGKTASDHVNDMLLGEIGLPFGVGGTMGRGEGQWRMEWASAGMPLHEPKISEVNLGIQIVYACHAKNEIIYFDDLEEIIDQKKHYRRKRGKDGEVTSEIENKGAFHYLDAERYIVGYIRSGYQLSDWEDVEGLGSIEDFESVWR